MSNVRACVCVNVYVCEHLCERWSAHAALFLKVDQDWPCLCVTVVLFVRGFEFGRPWQIRASDRPANPHEGCEFGRPRMNSSLMTLLMAMARGTKIKCCHGRPRCWIWKVIFRPPDHVKYTK